MTESISMRHPGRAQCGPATRVTRSLLGYGVIAGPLYVTTTLAEALTRAGFDLRRHDWSLLANGPLGWIHVADFIASGLMVVAMAVGLDRTLQTGRGRRWAPRLFAGYGFGLAIAGIFRADPALGFPPGTPDGPGTVSWHGMLHLVAASVGFACLIAACAVLARRLSGEGRRMWAVYSWATGVVFLAGFVGVAAGAGNVAVNLAFTAAVLVAWVWVSAVSVHYYRTAD
jgi:hypothetical protein